MKDDTTKNGQSAAKLLNSNEQGERSTTIPRGSTENDIFLGNGGNYYIYILLDPVNNKIRYVGKSIDPNKRYIKHISDSKRYVDKTAKSNWIRKLLKNNLKPKLKIILKCNSKEECDKLEIKYIKLFKNKGIELYNSTSGGDGGIIYNTCKPVLRYSLDGVFIEEFKSISDACRKYSIKHPLLSEHLNGKYNYCYNSIWKFKKEDFIINNIEMVYKTHEKPVNQYDLNNNFIKQWRSGIEASKHYKVHKTSIRNCCLGKSKSSCGFIWKYNN